MRRRIVHRSVSLSILLMVAAPAAFAQGTREALSIPREHRGKSISVPATLLLPSGTGKVPAMVIHHGSGGVSEAREFRYAKEMVAMGVAAVVIDSFKPRGIVSTVQNQAQVKVLEMTDDALHALKLLAAHPRIDANKVGVTGFSKGGSVALEAMIERRAQRAMPGGPRFALHVPVYPGCTDHYALSRMTGAPLYMLLGGADTYAGVQPCTEYGDKLKAKGVPVTVKIYPGAKHGFDGDRDYNDPKGENWSRCIFEEQADGSIKERTSGATTFAQGKLVDGGVKAARAACVKYGIEGGPNPAAKAAAMADLKAAVTKHLLGAP